MESQRRVHGSIDAIDSEAARDQRGRRQCPVQLSADVVNVCERGKAVVEVAAAKHEWHVKFGVQLAVTDADAKAVTEVMIDLDVELVAGRLRES